MKLYLVVNYQVFDEQTKLPMKFAQKHRPFKTLGRALSHAGKLLGYRPVFDETKGEGHYRSGSKTVVVGVVDILRF